jgi:hypothetical protein
MALPSSIRDRSAAIAERWLRDTLATYSERASAAFGQQQDPFANPVGHALRIGTRAVVDALVEEREPGEICQLLDDVVRIRAIQEFSSSQAVSFVFLLKEALRAELGKKDSTDPSISAELARLEVRIDQIVLGVFDIYVHYRTQLYELRVNEVKRSVARLLQKNGCGFPAPSNDDLLQLQTAREAEAERGGGR